MISDLLFIIGSIICIGWGISHLIPTKKIVSGFGNISRDNKLIIQMEWISEGFTICFIGILVLTLVLINLSNTDTGIVVVRMSSVMLIVMAILTQLTGAKTSIIPIKICPIVKSLVAVLWVIGSYGH